jgi:SAM-dependent methyltransferase
MSPNAHTTSSRHDSALTTAAPPLDLAAITSRQQAVWASGDFAVVARTIQIVAESLCETADVCAGERVLDVAAGTGNAAIAAARRFADVTATDFVPALLEHGSVRAAAEGVPVAFREADVQDLPFPDASFDVVLSTYGVMFAPDQERAAREVARVCRPGGRIALANWTPDGFIGQLFRLIGGYVPPPAGLRSPALWGTEPRLRELFGDDAKDVRIEPREFAFRYRSAAHWIEVFRGFYGPVHKAFLALEPPRQQALEADLVALLGRFDRGGAAGLVVPGAYVEAVITRR